MKQKRDMTGWVLVFLAAVFAALLMSRADSVRVASLYGGRTSFEGPKAAFCCLRDEWLAGPGFAPSRTRPGKARLELFNQLAVRPSFDSAPDYLLKAVPGIGRRIASALIAMRRGGHVSPKKLLSVPGVGHKRLKSLKRAFTFGPPKAPPDPIMLNL